MLKEIKNPLKICVIATLFLVPVLVVNGILLSHYADVSRERMAIGAERLARIMALQENRVIEGIRNMLSGISRFAEVQKRGDTGCNATLALLLEEINKGHIGRFFNLGVLDLNGNIVCSAVPLKQPVNAADRLYFQNAITTREFSVGEYQIGIITGMRSLNFGLPVLEENGAVKHVVFAALDLNSLGKDVGGLTIPGNASLTITDSRNKVLFRYPYDEKTIGVQWFPFHDEKEIEGNAEGKDIDGNTKIFGYSVLRPSRNGDYLRIFVGIPVVFPFSELFDLSLAEILSIILSILTVPAFSWYILRRMGR